MLLRQSRLCFRPAVVGLSNGAKTDRGERMGPRATLAVSPWLFIRRSSLRIRKTSELPDFRTSESVAALGEASPLCTQWHFFTQTERRPSAAKKLGDDALSKQSAPFLLRWSRPRRVWGKQASGRTLRGGEILAAPRLRFSPADLPAQVGEKRRSPSNLGE